MTWVPPVNRWSSRYSMSHPEFSLSFAVIYKSVDGSNELTVEAEGQDPISVPMDIRNVQGIFL